MIRPPGTSRNGSRTLYLFFSPSSIIAAFDLRTNCSAFRLPLSGLRIWYLPGPPRNSLNIKTNQRVYILYIATPVRGALDSGYASCVLRGEINVWSTHSRPGQLVCDFNKLIRELWTCRGNMSASDQEDQPNAKLEDKWRLMDRFSEITFTYR